MKLSHQTALYVVVVVCAAATMFATLRTSTTFDEIVMISAGARGFEHGEFNLAEEHPPLVQYLYGFPVYLSHPNYPPERPVPKGNNGFRYMYAQEFFWLVGNNPERIAFLGRLMAIASAISIVLLTWAFTRRVATEWTAIAAATLVAFLPDVLAHGGVAYNDLPLALGYFAALWALDNAVRRPTLKNGGIAGLLVALALSVKFSAGALVPAAALLVAIEACTRFRDTIWWKRLGFAVLASIVAGYVTLVIVYRFDFSLSAMRYGLDFTARHVSKGHGVPAYLLGHMSRNGFWYFYPVAFILKTPVALHILTVLAIAGAFVGRHAPFRELLRSRLRMPVVGLVVFLAFLMGARLSIGFRYALPALPLLLVLVAAGVHRLSMVYGNPVRMTVAALLVWYAASSLSWYPNYLAFTSEYRLSRDEPGREALLDSSLDWGQGLLQLRSFMRENNIQRIYLAYFGSGLPGGYGIRYVPMLSFFPLPSQQPRSGESEPQYGVISATLLHNVYTVGDPFATLRHIRPVAVIAHTLYVYRMD